MFVEKSQKKLQTADGAQSLKSHIRSSRRSQAAPIVKMRDDDEEQQQQQQRREAAADFGVSMIRRSSVREASRDPLRQLFRVAHESEIYNANTEKDRERRATSRLGHFAGEEIVGMKSWGMELKWIKRGLNCDTQA